MTIINESTFKEYCKEIGANFSEELKSLSEVVYNSENLYVGAGIDYTLNTCPAQKVTFEYLMRDWLYNVTVRFILPNRTTTYKAKYC